MLAARTPLAMISRLSTTWASSAGRPDMSSSVPYTCRFPSLATTTRSAFCFSCDAICLSSGDSRALSSGRIDTWVLSRPAILLTALASRNSPMISVPREGPSPLDVRIGRDASSIGPLDVVEMPHITLSLSMCRSSGCPGGSLSAANSFSEIDSVLHASCTSP